MIFENSDSFFLFYFFVVIGLQLFISLTWLLMTMKLMTLDPFVI